MSWSGSRDGEGYATGRGSLTYYRVNWKRVTGSNIPTGKPIMARQFSGKMVRGKFQGVIEMTTADGTTTHAKFADGVPAGKWLNGGAPEATGKRKQLHKSHPLRKKRKIPQHRFLLQRRDHPQQSKLTGRKPLRAALKRQRPSTPRREATSCARSSRHHLHSRRPILVFHAPKSSGRQTKRRSGAVLMSATIRTVK